MKNIITQINWNKNGGLVPAIIQDAGNNSVLMLGYMNKQSFQNTLKTKKVWFYSRSRARLWMKGETSKNFLKVREIKPDCDNDTLLIKVEPLGPTCHQGKYSCFEIKNNAAAVELSGLFDMILDRKKNMPKGSYTASLFKGGTEKISLKVAEEALEVIQAGNKQTKGRLVEETVDLLYHLFVLLAEKKVSIEEIGKEIKKRKK